MDKNDAGNEKSISKSAAGAHDSNLLDAASLFAYWNRDPASAAVAAASNQLFSSHFGAAAAGLGLLPNSSSGNDRYSIASTATTHHPNTMAVAASQAASLAGLHPAASWWSMAQLAAAQDYFNRLQASGLSQFGHTDMSGFNNNLSGLSGIGIPGSGTQGNSNISSSGAANSKTNHKQSRKERRQQCVTNNTSNNVTGIHNLGSNTTITPNSSVGSPNSYKSASSFNKPTSQSSKINTPGSISAYNPATLHKELLAMQAAAVSVAQQQHQQQNSKKNLNLIQNSGLLTSSNVNNNGINNKSLSSSFHLTSTPNSHQNSIFTSSGGSGGNNRCTSNNNAKDRNNEKTNQAQSSFNALNSLSQLSTLGLTSQQSVQAAMNALAASSDKAKEYIPQGILSDSSSLLGVRLPPDTEIIKYTSSIVGPKIPGTTNRGRKKTISLDPNPLLAFPGLSPAKRSRLEMEYAAVMEQVVAAQHAVVQATSGSSTVSSQNLSHPTNTTGTSTITASSAAVFAAAMMNSQTLNSAKTLTTLSSNSSTSIGGSTTSSPQSINRERNNPRENVLNSIRNDRRNDRHLEKDQNYDNSNADRVEVIKLPPTIPSNGAYNLMNKNNIQLTHSKDIDSDSSCINLSFKMNSSFIDDCDTPLNLSMKPSDKLQKNKDFAATSNEANLVNSLQSLSSITAALGSSNLSIQTGGSHNNTNNSANNNEKAVSVKEGRPRNLGRGVSKPKKNTVASLLAQSRAVGIKPILATQQLLQQGADMEKIRQVLEANSQIDLSTDSESVAAESGLSESESEDPNIINLSDLRVPLEMGWKRETIIRGLTKLGQIRGDVSYYSPGSTIKLKSIGQILTYLDKNPSNLSRDNFNFSSRAILGSFLQPAPPPYANDGEFIRMTDVDVAKRLEDLKIFTRQSLNVEQRIEIAKQQQAVRDAKKLAKEEMTRNKEKSRQEKNEKLEQQRKERDLKNQQTVEARKKKLDEIEKIKQDEVLKKQQEVNRQKELLYQMELERERRRQHISWVKQLDNRRKFEDREKKKHQLVLDRLILREKRVASRKRDSEILTQIRKPVEDSEIYNQVDLPEFDRLKGCRLSGQAMANLLMVFEFLHNFGETLGFDMNSVPSFQNLHDAIAANSNADTEEELLSIICHLLVCAIEDPGIPNPGRHTTLLGQSLRTADITNSNVSEILRIYLYAVAAGEIRHISGITLDREKERRVADHHQIDSEVLISTSGKNQQYYDLLHENETWKLSTCLNDKPFVALNPTKKTQILAHLVNDLLMNKAVLKQIEGSLESCAQIKREKYTNDMKIRKYKSLHIRKLRMESYEKAHQERELAIQHHMELNRKEGVGKAVTETQEKCETDNQFQISCEKIFEKNKTEENENARSFLPDSILAQKVEKMETDDNEVEPLSKTLTEINHQNDGNKNETDKNQTQIYNTLQQNTLVEDSPVKNSVDITDHANSDHPNLPGLNGITQNTGTEFNLVINNKKLNTTRVGEDVSTEMGMDEDISDVESVITNLEEDEDMKMSSDEVYKKLEKMIKQSEQMKTSLEQCSNQLRAQCYGQDRYWRRYWKLPKSGGILIEAMESAQDEICEYNRILEEKHLCKIFKNNVEESVNIKLYDVGEESEEVYDDQEKAVELATSKDKLKVHRNGEESEERIKKIPNDSITNESNSSITTKDKENYTIIKESESLSDFKNVLENKTIVDSVSSQKITESQKEICDKKLCSFPENREEIQKCENFEQNIDEKIDITFFKSNDNLLPPPLLIPTVSATTETNLNSFDSLILKPKELNKVKIKNEVSDDPGSSSGIIDDVPKFVPQSPNTAAEKWFSIINREMPLISTENQYIPEYQLAYSNITCDQNLQIQGHRWDIANNAQYFSVPVENNKIDLKYDIESVLTLSGIREEVIESFVGQTFQIKKEEMILEDDEMVGKANMTTGSTIKEEIFDIKTGKIEIKLEDTTCISLGNLANMTLNSISAYVNCDNIAPLSMMPDEIKMLENIKKNGFPKSRKNNFVPAKLRHGWWSIENLDILKIVINNFHSNGIRERELKQNLLKAINESVQLKIYFPLMEIGENELKFVEPDNEKNWSPKIAKRVELALLDQLEALEDKIASASMQVKHWQLPPRIDSDLTLEEEYLTEDDFVSIIPMLRERISNLEAAIERRYLKPPLGLQVGDAQLAAIAQNQMNNQQQQHNQQQQTQQHLLQTEEQIESQNQSSYSLNTQDEINNIQNINLVTTNSSGGESPSSIYSEEEQIENTPKALVQWREAVGRSHTTSQLAMALYVLETCVAWDKSIMKANCQFCSSGENEDKLLLCDGCDKGYHTYCFKPKMENIPDGDWYCYECLNKATSERKCIVCGGHRPLPVGKMVFCELCPRAFHSDCYIPPLLKVPRGKWYCQSCISKAPPPKKRSQKKVSCKETKEKEKEGLSKEKDKQQKLQIEQHNLSATNHMIMPSPEESKLSPNHSVASGSLDEVTNNINDGNNKYPSIVTLPPQALPSILSMTAATPTTPLRPSTPTSAVCLNNDTLTTDSLPLDETLHSNISHQSQLSPSTSINSNVSLESPTSSTPNQSINFSQKPFAHQPFSVPSSPLINSSKSNSPETAIHQHVQQHLQVLHETKEKLKLEKKDKHATKKLIKELAACKSLLADMEIHEDSWPFLLPVNTKQFPTYKKIIKNPMDLSTIKKRLQDLVYKSREEFVNDVRQIFDNCEMFNEDDSPVGKAGHGMRNFFEIKWAELADKNS